MAEINNKLFTNFIKTYGSKINNLSKIDLNNDIIDDPDKKQFAIKLKTKNKDGVVEEHNLLFNLEDNKFVPSKIEPSISPETDQNTINSIKQSIDKIYSDIKRQNSNTDFTNTLELTKEEMAPIAKQVKQDIVDNIKISDLTSLKDKNVTPMFTIGKLIESKHGTSKLLLLKEKEQQSVSKSFQILVTLSSTLKLDNEEGNIDNNIIDSLLKELEGQFNSSSKIKKEYNTKAKEVINFLIGDGSVNNYNYSVSCTGYKVLNDKSGYLVITVTKTLGKQLIKNAYDKVTNSQIYKDAHDALGRAYNALGKVNMG